jgi:tRNA1(Val) A37 N6-methylase TrmN6
MRAEPGIMRESPGAVSEDAVLGGALRLRQPRRGHRVGHDAVLLAAACPAQGGEHVVDLGAGVGAAGLAVARRVPGIAVTLVEIDPELAALAAENAELNGLAARVNSINLDVAAPARAFAAAGVVPDRVDRVLMNPPFNDPVRQRTSPDRRRRLAHAAPRESLAAWIRTAARLLRPNGTLTLIFRADGLVDLGRALDTGFGAVTVLPVYPKPDQPAVRILVRATKASRAPLALLPGLVLNDVGGRPTAQAEAVLRAGAALPLAHI